MKIREIRISKFKRFTNFKLTNIPQDAKLIVIVGENGSGKSSLFDAFNHYYRKNSGFGINTDLEYYKKGSSTDFNWHQTVEVSFHDQVQGELPKNSMYFRTAYRNDPDFQIRNFTRLDDPSTRVRINRLIDNDVTVSANYQRLVQNTMNGVFDENNDAISVKDLRERLIGKIRESLARVFSDLNLNNIGDPLGDGSFYFEKGDVESFHYKNLSAGEKSAFDLLLDLIIKIDYYQDSTYFIDEPETHMHTSLQSKLIHELFNIVPEESQLWITSHSLGVLQKAKELSVDYPGQVQFIDFSGINFDNETILEPANIDGVVWNKFLSVTIGDYSNILAPETIVMCEGSIGGNRRRNFDSIIYSKIFRRKYPNLTFVSGGACSELENDSNIGIKLLANVLSNTRIFRVIDRDDKSDVQVEELKERSIFVTSRRNLECYILDDEIIEKYLLAIGKIEFLQDVLLIKAKALQSSIDRGNPPDDLKRASGEFYTGIKSSLHLTRTGDNVDSFMKDILAEYITEDTQVFAELETIFLESGIIRTL